MGIISILAVVVNVIIVNGDYGLTLEEWKNVRQETKAIFSREYPHGNIKLSFETPIFAESSTTYTIANSSQAYFDWRDRLKAEKKKGLWLVVLPPTTDGYIAGLARMACFKNFNLSPAVVFLKSKANSGESRIIHGAYVVAHELGHSLNAPHLEDSMSIMHPAPLPWVDQGLELPFDIRSKRSMRRCAR